MELVSRKGLEAAPGSPRESYHWRQRARQVTEETDPKNMSRNYVRRTHKDIISSNKSYPRGLGSVTVPWPSLLESADPGVLFWLLLPESKRSGFVLAQETPLPSDDGKGDGGRRKLSFKMWLLVAWPNSSGRPHNQQHMHNRNWSFKGLRRKKKTNKKRYKVGVVGKWSCLRKELGGRIFLIKIHWQKFSKI